jgi:hypothetical protein
MPEEIREKSGILGHFGARKRQASAPHPICDAKFSHSKTATGKPLGDLARHSAISNEMSEKSPECPDISGHFRTSNGHFRSNFTTCQVSYRQSTWHLGM